MALIQVVQTDTVDGFRIKVNQLSAQQGDLVTLNTNAKSSIVSAVNELKGNIAALQVPPTPDSFDIVGNAITSLTTSFQYSPNLVEVFVNGIRLKGTGNNTDYQAVNGTTVDFPFGFLKDGDNVIVKKL